MTDGERIAYPAAIWGTVGAVAGMLARWNHNGTNRLALVLAIVGAGIGALLGWRIVRKRRGRW
jgi:hypothetical protein